MTQFKLEGNDDQEILFGSAQESITPYPYKQLSLSGYGRFQRCKGFHDKIYARVNLFATKDDNDDVKIHLVLINYDLTGFGFQNMEILKTKLADEFNIREAGIYAFSTHSHYSPDTDGLMPAPIFPNIIWKGRDPYLTEFIIKQTIKSVKSALKELRPVKVGFGYTQFQERMVFNRRPPKGYYYILHPRINIIKITDLDDKLIGAISVFPSHPVTIGRQYNEISGGWPGYFVRALKSKIGETGDKDDGFIPLILQGPAGDVTFNYRNPKEREELLKRSRKDRQYYKAQRFGELLADYVTKKLPNINTDKLVKIVNDAREIYMPVTPIYNGYNPKQLFNILAAAIKRVILIPGLKLFRRSKEVSFVKMEKYRPKGRVFKELRVKTFVGTFALNEIIVTTNPGEPFNITEEQIRDRTGNENVVLAQLCNDCIGYNYSDPEKVYYPETYDIEMTFTQYTGLLTRNTAIKEVKEVSKKID